MIETTYAVGEESLPEGYRLTEADLDRLAGRTVYILRRLFAADPKAMESLFGTYVGLTTGELLDDPTCQCGGLDRAKEHGISTEHGTLSPLGVLNAMHGLIPGSSWGRLMTVWADRDPCTVLQGFDLTTNHPPNQKAITEGSDGVPAEVPGAFSEKP